MPRPKRSRVPPSRPPAALRESSTTPPPSANPPAVANRKQSSDDIYDVSDREKERQLQRAAARRSLLEMNPEQVNAVEDSRHRRDNAMDKLADITSTSKNTDETSAEQDSPAIELSRREESPSMLMPARITDVSGLELDDSTFGNLDDSLDDSHQDGIEESRSGYRSTDTSSFNINLFKRRPRQSSIVGKDDAPIRPSSRGQNTPSISSHLNLGNFRRRVREPSILGTAQKDRSYRPPSRAGSHASRNGNLTADEDSGPDDESTPLNLAKRRSGAATEPVEPEDVHEQIIEASPSLPSRKRKSGDNLEGGREKRPSLRQPEGGEEQKEEVIHQSIEASSSLSVIPSTPANRSVRDHFSTPVHDPNDPDMAPPASSGSSEGASPIVWPSLDTLARRTYNPNRRAATRTAQKTPELEADNDDNSSILSSPPSLTHSPNYAGIKTRPTRNLPAKKTQPASAPPKPKVTTTADLTSLLPRRRTKAKKSRDLFDLESSSVVGDDAEAGSGNEDGEGDELSIYVAPKSAAARRRGAARKGKNDKGKEKETEMAKSKKIRTYGSRGAEEEEEAEVEEDEIVVGSGVGTGVSSDGEQDADDQGVQEVDPETSQVMLERLGEELQHAVKKFKEVDRWELSFEEVTESSSPLPEGR